MKCGEWWNDTDFRSGIFTERHFLGCWKERRKYVAIDNIKWITNSHPVWGQQQTFIWSQYETGFWREHNAMQLWRQMWWTVLVTSIWSDSILNSLQLLRLDLKAINLYLKRIMEFISKYFGGSLTDLWLGIVWVVDHNQWMKYPKDLSDGNLE